MRTVISHFFNEEYLLPWWLKHHVKMFDHGILIDHGSTDNSVEICRQIAPHWQVVPSRLKQFDAWLTDFEVMTHELNVPGWKIALNTTEFIVSNPGLDEVERFLRSQGRMGVAASGMCMIDKAPAETLAPELPLVTQKPWAIDDNRFRWRWVRKLRGYPKSPQRNRFYHCLPNGMYTVGRHSSLHSDWDTRLPNLMILHYAYAPWTQRFIERKMQIASKIPAGDIARRLGTQHMRNSTQLEQAFEDVNNLPYVDLRQSQLGRWAIGVPDPRPTPPITSVRQKR
jgi:hypothetical protein